MLMLCGGKEQGDGKDTRPGRGSLELEIDGVAPSLFFKAFHASVCKFSPSRRVSVWELGQGGGIAAHSVAVFSFSTSPLLCSKHSLGLCRDGGE